MNIALNAIKFHHVALCEDQSDHHSHPQGETADQPIELLGSTSAPAICASRNITADLMFIISEFLKRLCEETC